MTKIAILILFISCSLSSYDKGYLGYSTADAEYLNSEFDRTYESNRNALTQWKFAYKSKDFF